MSIPNPHFAESLIDLEVEFGYDNRVILQKLLVILEELGFLEETLVGLKDGVLLLVLAVGVKIAEIVAKFIVQKIQDRKAI